eukprot:353930-Chlamydomonas_euryale.AAC.2
MALFCGDRRRGAERRHVARTVGPTGILGGDRGPWSFGKSRMGGRKTNPETSLTSVLDATHHAMRGACCWTRRLYSILFGRTIAVETALPMSVGRTVATERTTRSRTPRAPRNRLLSSTCVIGRNSGDESGDNASGTAAAAGVHSAQKLQRRRAPRHCSAPSR